MKKKVLLGLSGGVDSAIAAHLLLEDGYDVTGCYMRNWDAQLNNDFLGNPTIHNDQCPQEKDYQDAKEVAEKLHIPLLRIDYIEEYWENVFQYFLKEYKEGRTPNPDVLCNREIKFGPFMKYAKEHGFDAIAMGHYAKKVKIDGRYYLTKPLDSAKDQTYFLCALSEEQIAFSLFPMANITKVEARQIAKELGLSNVSEKHGSTGVCFIGERRFREFLMNYFPATKGPIVDVNSKKVLGEHPGVLYFTLGQRHGLGIGGVKGEKDGAWFVCKKDAKKNILYVANGDEDEHLLSDRCSLVSLNWLPPQKENRKVFAKFRYRQPDNPAFIHFEEDGSAFLTYDPPVKAVTPGQWAVFYDENDILLGGAIIDKVYRNEERIDL